MSSAVKVLLVLLDPQVVTIADILTKVLIGEPYNVSQLEQCLSWLTAEAGDRVNCPLERWAMSQLADEVAASIQASSIKHAAEG
ncbi:MAG: hypothetical protein RBJ76_01385 [Stenomitos frigidus ULC029]